MPDNALLRHPAIRQAALIALPDASMGERSVAVIVSDAALKPSALRRHLSAAGLASYKLPEIRLVLSLPMTATGKVKKQDLATLL